MSLLEIEGLTIRRDDGAALVDDVALSLGRGERLALVGESGSGKTLTALATIGLLPPGVIASGRIRLEGIDLLTLAERDWCRLRGRRIAMVFQEPLTALDPVMTIGAQVGEAAATHLGLRGRALTRHVRERLAEVGLDPTRIDPGRYPHELSGGQRQRVMIAAALAAEPDLILADEPTSALDVEAQRVVLDLLRALCTRHGTALLLITHDLAVAHYVAQRIVVLYAGTVMESGPIGEVLRRSAHPYTHGLLLARPGRGEAGRPLTAIPGLVPPADARPPGCRFHPRCARSDTLCRTVRPPLAATAGDRRLACHHPLAAGPP
jgi:peptide/nickel transport system ATP-binding protein